MKRKLVHFVEGENVGKKVLSILFCVFITIFMLKSHPYAQVERLINYFKQDESAIPYITTDDLQTQYLIRMWKQEPFIEWNGWMAGRLKMQGYYSSMGMYVTDDKYIVNASDITTTDYEYEQIMSFKRFLDERGIHLLYVNEPTKYLEDSLLSDQFGIESYSNRNADLFMKRIAESGIHAIDLRKELVEDGWDIRDMFYRTDHHWTVRSGLWAAGKIAEGLNEYCGYSIDTSIYEEDRYSFTDWKECWLGEQGRKLAASYVGLDDYTEIKPNFATSYLFSSEEGQQEGTFDDFIDESVYREKKKYFSKSWHYSYEMKNAVNTNVDYGKVLILADSYDHVMEPFLTLGISKVDTLILRDFNGSLRSYIDDKDYDTVIVSYAQFMIGAHDQPRSDNYSMFEFDK